MSSDTTLAVSPTPEPDEARVERYARAIYAAGGHNPDLLLGGSSDNPDYRSVPLWTFSDVAARAAIALADAEAAERGAGTGWQPIESAPKDGTAVLLKLKHPVPHDREDLRRWDGLCFVGDHPGVEADGFDIGWRFAAPVGQGGFPDDWFEGWRPLPAPSVTLPPGSHL